MKYAELTELFNTERISQISQFCQKLLTQTKSLFITKIGARGTMQFWHTGNHYCTSCSLFVYHWMKTVQSYLILHETVGDTAKSTPPCTKALYTCNIPMSLQRCGHSWFFVAVFGSLHTTVFFSILLSLWPVMAHSATTGGSRLLPPARLRLQNPAMSCSTSAKRKSRCENFDCFRVNGRGWESINNT